MKKITKINRTLTLFLAFLLLMTAVIGRFSVHFCDENIKSIAFFNAEIKKSCSHKGKKCCKNPEKSVCLLDFASSCCSTNNVSSNISSFFVEEISAKAEKTLPSKEIIKINLDDFIPFEEILTQKQVSLLNYFPPLLSQDIIILCERFLC